MKYFTANVPLDVAIACVCRQFDRMLKEHPGLVGAKIQIAPQDEASQERGSSSKPQPE